MGLLKSIKHWSQIGRVRVGGGGGILAETLPNILPPET